MLKMFLKVAGKFKMITYRKVLKRSRSHLVAPSRIFRLLTKEKFDVTFYEKVDFCNSSPIYCSQLYGIQMHIKVSQFDVLF